MDKLYPIDHGPAMVCSKCKVAKEPNDFSRARNRPTGRYPTCKRCKAVDTKARWEKDPERLRAQARAAYYRHRDARREDMRRYHAEHGSEMADQTRRRYLVRVYGLTAEDYDALSGAQDNRCAICRREETDRDPRARTGKRRLAVDHCHDTGAIRGLLCRKCNTAVGLFGEDPAVVKAALDYLNGGAIRGDQASGGADNWRCP